jgi:hypothetical protein
MEALDRIKMERTLWRLQREREVLQRECQQGGKLILSKYGLNQPNSSGPASLSKMFKQKGSKDESVSREVKKPHNPWICMINQHKIGLRPLLNKLERMPLISEKKEDLFADVQNFAYKRPWNKMSEVHRMFKLRQFMTKLGYEGVDIDKMAKAVYDQIKQKQLRVKDIIYDPKTMQVLRVENMKSNIVLKLDKYMSKIMQKEADEEKGKKNISSSSTTAQKKNNQQQSRTKTSKKTKPKDDSSGSEDTSD